IYDKPLAIPTGVRQRLRVKRRVKESSSFLSNHRVDTCVALSFPPDIEDNQGWLLRMHLPWQSQELSNFCQNLDKATVERIHTEKGAQYVQRSKMLELSQQPAINTSELYPVPGGLPPNCYNPHFLESKPKVPQDVLKSHHKSVELPSI
ncbi:uncharacterized protein VP01_9686g1, partial [Puccinia sorghi]